MDEQLFHTILTSLWINTPIPGSRKSPPEPPGSSEHEPPLLTINKHPRFVHTFINNC